LTVGAKKIGGSLRLALISKCFPVDFPSITVTFNIIGEGVDLQHD